MILILSLAMGKGRKVASNHWERLLGCYGYDRSPATRSDHADLGEDEVWSTIYDEDTMGVSAGNFSRRVEIDDNRAIRTTRWVARKDLPVGGLSLAFESGRGRTKNPPAAAAAAAARIVHQIRQPENSPSIHAHQSAPVNVPDRPKILRENSGELSHVESPRNDETEWLPPHEYLAREYARSTKTATSVFEGVGRTLKGRDMSRVRNAVWSQTGFPG